MIVDIAVICPREVEFKEIRKILKSAQLHTSADKKVKFEFGQISGKHFNWNVAVVEPDFTTYTFALKTTQVILALKPTYLFLAGVAGGIKDVKLGDLVIGTEACSYEFGKDTADGSQARAIATINKNRELLTLAKRLMRSLEMENPPGAGHPKHYMGLIASGDKVIASKESASYKKIKSNFESTLAVEMEAFDFANIAEESQIEYLNIRGISDLIDNKAVSDQSGSQVLASSRVKSFLGLLIFQLPTPHGNPIYKQKIKITDQVFTRTWRKHSLGELELFAKYLKITFANKTLIIKSLLEIEHYKMPDDLSKSWIKIKFLNHGKMEELFIADAKSYSLSAWIGGGVNLLKEFTAYQEKQIKVLGKP